MPADAESLDRVSDLLRDFSLEFQTDEGAKGRSKSKSVLSDEAQAAYKKQDYEASLQKFAKYLAAVLLDSPIDHEVEASLLANVGSCLHHLGENELAKVRTAHTTHQLRPHHTPTRKALSP
jgi:hypothetical protein